METRVRVFPSEACWSQIFTPLGRSVFVFGHKIAPAARCFCLRPASSRLPLLLFLFSVFRGPRLPASAQGPATRGPPPLTESDGRSGVQAPGRVLEARSGLRAYGIQPYGLMEAKAFGRVKNAQIIFKPGASHARALGGVRACGRSGGRAFGRTGARAFFGR